MNHVIEESGLGSARALACTLRRLAAEEFQIKREASFQGISREGARNSTRGRVPQKSRESRYE
jgi:hypothetical protein